MDLTIIIVNWNTKNLLQQCLASLEANPPACSSEIIVVDNGSVDGSQAMVQRDFPLVTLIANEENKGFAAANNQAILTSQGENILLLNSDTIVLPNALDIMLKFMRVHPEVGGVGCRLLNEDGTVQRSCWYGFPSLAFALIDALYLWKILPNSRLVRKSEVSVGEASKAIAVDHLLGACMLIRREVVEQVGLMDESYFLFLEETDWCYRIKEAGWEIYYVPEAQIVHLGERSVYKVPQRTLPQMYQSYCKFYGKHRSDALFHILLLKAIIAVAACIRIVLWTLRTVFSGEADKTRMVEGYWKVLAELSSM